MATLADFYKSVAGSGGVYTLALTSNTTATTAATATTGFVSFQIVGNQIGSVWPNTIAELQTTNGPDNTALVNIMATATVARGSATALIYKVGSVNFTATGNRFTHDAATFPLLRDEMGLSNQPQAYLPFLRVTTAITGVSPVIRLQTATGGAGYVDQDGVNVIGTTSISIPLSLVGTCYFLPLNTGSACRDILQVRVDTAATGGVAEVWMYEELVANQTVVAGAGIYDVFGGSGLNLAPAKPAMATAGSATTLFVTTNYSNAAASLAIMQMGT